MRVYKFLTCKYGLKALRERRLKISEVRSLNDPFELIPFDLSDPDLRQAVMKTRNEIGADRGLLCFSQHWHNPVLWAHYADSHKGVCLGFDVPGDGAQAVDYIEKPLKLTRLNYEVANKMLFTKYEHWRYEEELRMWATLEEKSGSSLAGEMPPVEEVLMHLLIAAQDAHAVIVGDPKSSWNERRFARIALAVAFLTAMAILGQGEA